jgi:hypothetical protein
VGVSSALSSYLHHKTPVFIKLGIGVLAVDVPPPSPSPSQMVPPSVVSPMNFDCGTQVFPFDMTTDEFSNNSFLQYQDNRSIDIRELFSNTAIWKFLFSYA